MSETIKPQSTEQTSAWEESMKELPTFEDRPSVKSAEEIKRIKAEIAEREQAVVDIQNGAKDDYRAKRDDESVDEYSEYLLSYLRGEAMIENAQKKAESKADCASRLIEKHDKIIRDLSSKITPNGPKVA